jgi:hypothetical protein
MKLPLNNPSPLFCKNDAVSTFCAFNANCAIDENEDE